MSAKLAMLPNPCFLLGKIVATPGALEALAKVNCLPITLLNRHHRGDWGDVDKSDWDENTNALSSGRRIFSAYVIKNIKFWVITESDRSATTILLPEEY